MLVFDSIVRPYFAIERFAPKSKSVNTYCDIEYIEEHVGVYFGVSVNEDVCQSIDDADYPHAFLLVVFKV